MDIVFLCSFLYALLHRYSHIYAYAHNKAFSARRAAFVNAMCVCVAHNTKYNIYDLTDRSDRERPFEAVCVVCRLGRPVCQSECIFVYRL